jgi:hypothetical protein
VTGSGSVWLTWQSRAGSCEAVGLCGIAGSVRYSPHQIEATFARAGHRWKLDFVSAEDANSSIVRESRSQPGQPDGTCIDSIGTDLIDGLVARSASRGQWATVGLGGYYPEDGPLSAGRCAGPLPVDIASALPSAPFRVGRAIDLRATRTFAVGPFAGRVVSSLVLHAGSIHVDHSSQTSPGPPNPTVFAVVTVPYRIDSATGGFDATLAGDGTSGCGIVDACGTSGRLDFSLTGLAGTTMTIEGAKPLRPGQRYTRAQAISDLQSGRLFNFGGFDQARTIRRLTAETLSRLGSDTPCQDSSTGPAPDFRADSAGTNLRFAVDGESIGGLGDLMRTRCPGPGLSDVVGQRPILAGTIPMSSIGSDQLQPTLTATGSFDTGAWTGSRGGSMNVTLTRSGPITIKRLSSKAYQG